MTLAPTSDELGVQCPPSSTLRTDLIDRHFAVREAIGAFMSSPTTAARVEVQRAVHAFLAAERALLDAEPTLADRHETESDEAQGDEGGEQLLAALEALNNATSRRDMRETAEALRHRFLGLSRVHLP
jgi:hypothetical protein